MRISLKPLSRQCLVITGASSGIGLATARMAAKAGAKVVLAARDLPALEQLAAEISRAGGQALAVQTDVGREDQVDRLAEKAVARFGSFDTWVNDAGVSIFGQCWEVTTDDMRRMFDTNYWGVVYGSRAAIRHFSARGKKGTAGALINVGSFFGDRATPVQSTYSSSKFAVHGWTDALRMEAEHAGLPVSVTLIHPGRIDTPYNEHARSYMDRQPAHRGMIYSPEAVAEAILFAAAHPKRDIFVGTQAKLAAVVGNLLPRFADKFMEMYMYRSQLADRPSQPRDTPGLHEPGYSLQERGTHQGFVRGRSLYVRASTHPVLTAALGLASVALVLGAMPRGGTRPRARAGAHRGLPSATAAVQATSPQPAMATGAAE
jgi:short-subunit dehydrogenase